MIKRKLITKEQQKEIIKLYQSGLGSDTISRQFNVHPNSILKVLQRNNIPRRPRVSIFSAQDFQNMCAMYKDGYSGPRVAKEYDISTRYVAKILQVNNVQMRNSSECHRKYKINESFFDEIDTEEKAYFLGFLYADGCNYVDTNHFCIQLHVQDKEILEKFAKIIYIDNPLSFISINDRRFESRDRGIMCSIAVNSKHMSRKLEKHGCMQRKTFILKWPDWMPNKLVRHFIRGYFDGDGTIYNVIENSAGCQIISTEQLLQGIYNNCHKFNIKMGIDKCSNDKDKNTYRIRFSGNRNINRFMNFIYYGATIYLNRKHNRYLQFIDKMKQTDDLCRSGTRGYPKSNLIKQYPVFSESLKIENHQDVYEILNYIRMVGPGVFDHYSSEFVINNSIKKYFINDIILAEQINKIINSYNYFEFSFKLLFETLAKYDN